MIAVMATPRQRTQEKDKHMELVVIGRISLPDGILERAAAITDFAPAIAAFREAVDEAGGLLKVEECPDTVPDGPVEQPAQRKRPGRPTNAEKAAAAAALADLVQADLGPQE